MNVLTRLASVIGLGVAAAIASTAPARADDWGVSVHGGGWNNGWSVQYRDHDRHHGYGHGNRYYGGRQPQAFTPYRPGYYAHSRYRDHDRRSYSRRDPWCTMHRVYHVHHRGGGYAQGYRNGYADGYRDGSYQHDDYGSAAYYDRIEDMAYDTSIYYGRRW